MMNKALASGLETGGRVDYPDLVFMLGLSIMILFLPLSETLKNVGYALALAGWIIKKAVNRRFQIRMTPFGGVLSLYLLTSLLSAAFAVDPREGLRGAWDVFRPLSLFVMMVNDVETLPKIRLCLLLFIISTTIGVAWGLFDNLSGRDFRLEIRSLGYPNHTATYLAMMLAVLISLLLLMEWSTRVKMLVWTVAGATMLALFLTYSRGGWIAFAACLLFLSISLKQWKPIVAIALLGTGILVGLQVTGRLWTRQITMLAHLDQDENALQRLRMWRGSVLSLKDRPLLGVGPRNFKNLDHERYGLPRFDHAHSLFFTVLAERGLLGFLALMAVLACYLYEAIKLRPLQDVLSRALRHAAIGSFIALVVAGTVNTTLRGEVAIALCSFMALALAAAKGATSAGQDPS
ncbi:MAG TPA: O-antigen ligase family protein [Verrucomicrobiae bacterium]|nr:O-antigen ligase family protein [Verrucomicrobiae bacterium]